MNGGYQILDLRKIDIQIDDEEVAITDEDVLTQLRNLSEFLDIQTGLLSKQLKPIYILMNNSAGYGEISLVEEGKFLIQADFNNAKLSLLVVIGSDTDDDGNPYFYLDSATYTYNNIINSEWEKEINLEIRSDYLNGITISETQYCKLLIKNGVAYIVLSFGLANETESAISTDDTKPLFAIILSDEVSEKLYRKDGTKVSEAPNTNYNILSKNAYLSSNSGDFVSTQFFKIQSTLAKNVAGYLKTFSMGAGATRLVDLRVFITL